MFVRKLIESGNHGFATPIHEIPTKIKSLDLYLKYLNNIEKPIEREIKTKIKLKLPCNKSTNSRAKYISYSFLMKKSC